MIKSVRLFELESKFKRHHGWAGADGVFSIAYNNDVFWYFSDTFIGDSSEDDQRLNFELINNSLAISNMDLSEFKFIYNENPIASIFIPQNGYLWLQDYILINDDLYISALNMENDIFSNEIFKITGLSFVKLKMPFTKKVEYQIIPLKYYKENIIIGTSIIKENEYFYLFGYRNDFQNKKLILARTLDLLNDEVEYLQEDGSWKNDVDRLKILKENFSSEFKVCKFDNKYYIAYTKHSLGKEIYLLQIEDLFNPYTKEILVYECVEHQGSIIAYNSKIQEGISNGEEIIISYNVNTLINEEHSSLDIYRPRFIKLRKEDIDNEFKKIK